MPQEENFPAWLTMQSECARPRAEKHPYAENLELAPVRGDFCGLLRPRAGALQPD